MFSHFNEQTMRLPLRKLFLAFMLLAVSSFGGVVLAQTGSIEARVWNDKNGNGKQDDSNANLGDIEVKLIRTSDNFELQAVDTDLITGIATFTNVPVGTQFKLEFDLPADHKFTARKAASTNNTNDSDVHASGNKKATTDPFSLSTAGQKLTTLDCGMWAPGTLEVQVWNDKNGNGKRDDSNAALNGITVEMLDVNNSNAVIGSDVTASGLATITGVPADRPVKLRVVLPDDHKFTARNANGTNESNDSDVHASGNKKGTTDPFSLTAGAVLPSPIRIVACGLLVLWKYKSGTIKTATANATIPMLPLTESSWKCWMLTMETR
jgi:hypothetical protein